MQKFIFGFLVFIGVVIFVQIFRIVIYDINLLTEYGFGFLTGLIIIFLITTILATIVGLRLFKKNRLP